MAGVPLDLSKPAPPRSGVRLLLSALRAQRRGALCGVLAGVCWTAAKLTIPVLVRRGIDLGIRAGDQQTLAVTVVLILFVGLLGAGLAGLRRYFGISVAARVEADLRARLFVHLLRLDLGFHARTPAGQLVSRSASDLQQIQQPFVNILIARFYDVSRGSVRIDGVDVRDLPLSTLRSMLGMVFEDALLLRGSIRDNIAFGSPDADDAAVERAARAAGAHDFIIAQEGGYGALVGERVFRLSGGQRQRVALARALLHDPRVLVLDAATSVVEAEKEAEIQVALAQVLRGRTAIVITHRAATLQLADRVLLLADGRIADTGTHHELLERSAAYRGILATEPARCLLPKTAS